MYGNSSTSWTATAVLTRHESNLLPPSPNLKGRREREREKGRKEKDRREKDRRERKDGERERD
jgi:hypothetical protein